MWPTITPRTSMTCHTTAHWRLLLYQACCLVDWSNLVQHWTNLTGSSQLDNWMYVPFLDFNKKLDQRFYGVGDLPYVNWSTLTIDMAHRETLLFWISRETFSPKRLTTLQVCYIFAPVEADRRPAISNPEEFSTEKRENWKHASAVSRPLTPAHLQCQGLSRKSTFLPVKFNKKFLEEQKAVDCVKKNPNYFFSYAERFSKLKSNIEVAH